MGAGVGWERTLLRLSLNERSSIHSVLAESVDRPVSRAWTPDACAGESRRPGRSRRPADLVRLRRGRRSGGRSDAGGHRRGADRRRTDRGARAVVAAAPQLARSIGYDIDAALEEADDTVKQPSGA